MDASTFKTTKAGSLSMAEQTRLAKFESMRKGPSHARSSRNRKLFLVHQELQKQCERHVRLLESDNRLLTLDMRRRENRLKEYQERLTAAKMKVRLEREKTHDMLETTRRHHVDRERTLIGLRLPGATQQQPQPQRVTEREFTMAINALDMPLKMKERLRRQAIALQYI